MQARTVSSLLLVTSLLTGPISAQRLPPRIRGVAPTFELTTRSGGSGRRIGSPEPWSAASQWGRSVASSVAASAQTAMKRQTALGRPSGAPFWEPQSGSRLVPWWAASSRRRSNRPATHEAAA